MDPFLFPCFALPLGYLGALLAMSHAATSLLNRGHVHSAIRLFRLGVRLNLDRGQQLLCRSNLMASYHAIEDYASVEEEWRFIRPRLPEMVPFAGLATACYCATLVCQGRYREAVELSQQPEAMLPEKYAGHAVAELCDSLRLTNLGAALSLLGELEGASECIQRACSKGSPNSVLKEHLQLVRGRLLYLQGLTEDAAGTLRAVNSSKIPPLYVEELELNRAKLLARCGKPEEAERLLDVVGCLDTNRLRLLRLEALAAISEQRNDVERALHLYAQLLPSGLPAGETFLRAGNLARNRGDLALAGEFFQAVLACDPESVWATIARKRVFSS
ncbi:MAG: tetratricopeptide repeat protein [Armatimonadetes bacterium]|nr:tetratricopeptide repeat protein [Armatimonadota bacterium]